MVLTDGIDVCYYKEVKQKDKPMSDIKTPSTSFNVTIIKKLDYLRGVDSSVIVDGRGWDDTNAMSIEANKTRTEACFSGDTIQSNYSIIL
jgi:hypothetical protein